MDELSYEPTRRRDSASGFSLVEVVVATGILATGLLSLAGVFALGLRHMGSSTPSLIAREKARQAVESVHTARDMGSITWAKIRNTSAGGVFLVGAKPLNTPGADGLVNTADDGAVETQVTPGPDNVLGNTDDLTSPLTGFTRQITISDIVTAGVVNPNLRQLTVTIRYRVPEGWRTYSLTTFISSYS